LGAGFAAVVIEDGKKWRHVIAHERL
jgi:hypothetical protein